MPAFDFSSKPHRDCFFSQEKQIWPLAMGEILRDGPILRGWFYAMEPIPIGTRGEICIIGPTLECHTAVDVLVSFQAGELGMFRHEFTSVPSEVAQKWAPVKEPSEPVPLDMLRALCQGMLGWDGATAVFDREGLEDEAVEQLNGLVGLSAKRRWTNAPPEAIPKQLTPQLSCRAAGWTAFKKVKHAICCFHSFAP